MEGGGEASDSGGAATTVIKFKNSDESDAVNINIRRSNGTEFSVQAILESSVESFKSVIANNCNVAAEDQRLVYKGWILNDNRTLKSYGLEAQHTVHLVGGFQLAESINTSNTITMETMAGSSGSSISITDFSGFPEFEQVVQQVQLSIHETFHNPCILMTKVLLYHLIHNQDAMANMIVTSPQWNHEDNTWTPYISGLLNDLLLYSSLVCEIIRGMYISRGGGGDVITLLMENPTTSQMLDNLLWNLKFENWKFDPELDLMTRKSMLKVDLSEAAIAKFQEALYAEHRQEQIARDASEIDSETARALEDITGLITGGSTTPNNHNSNVGPEEMYASQLAQLQEMGFTNTRQNLEALVATAGNVEEAVDRLLGQ